jgi:predicted O-linked N-acetylglucosamine transferase (SPINDLY family)
MRGMFDFHDKKSFKIFAFSHGPMTYDPMQKHIIEKVDDFIDVRNLSDSQIIDLMRSKNIDILINRNGFTRNNRSSLFLNRIAPVQINFLGYPGTLGMKEIDYIIADKAVIPKDFRSFYSEKIIYMPSCYQPNDLRRFNGKCGADRAEYGLPRDKIIFVCFNNSYKISLEEFKIWMEVLLVVPDSILWLLKSNKVAEKNILRYAQQLGVDKERIIFAPRVSQKEHLARQSLADIFLDTFNYNAHTTASDALLMGIPIVTLKGRQFSARVAASLLTSLNLTELITDSKEEYKNLIIRLAFDPIFLDSCKKKLQVNLFKSNLFDAKYYTRHFELALIQAYKKFLNGERHEDIFV